MSKKPSKTTPAYHIFLYSSAKLEKVQSACGLSAIDFEIHTFENFLQAQKVFKAHDYHLLIVDLDDHKIKSYQFFEWVHEENPNMDIMGITETNPVEVIVKAIKNGIHDVLNTSSNLYPLQNFLVSMLLLK